MKNTNYKAIGKSAKPNEFDKTLTTRCENVNAVALICILKSGSKSVRVRKRIERTKYNHKALITLEVT